MRLTLPLIVLFGIQAQAYFIRADRGDVVCASHFDRNGGFLDVQVKGKTVFTAHAGVGPTGANAGEAYCNGVLEFARLHNRTGIFIDTNSTTVTERTLTVENLFCE